jgi:hypothetical protein
VKPEPHLRHFHDETTDANFDASRVETGKFNPTASRIRTATLRGWWGQPEGSAILLLLRDDDYEQFVREQPMPPVQWLQFARDFQDADGCVKTLLQERGDSIIRAVTAEEELYVPATLASTVAGHIPLNPGGCSGHTPQ